MKRGLGKLALIPFLFPGFFTVAAMFIVLGIYYLFWRAMAGTWDVRSPEFLPGLTPVVLLIAAGIAIFYQLHSAGQSNIPHPDLRFSSDVNRMAKRDLDTKSQNFTMRSETVAEHKLVATNYGKGSTLTAKLELMEFQCTLSPLTKGNLSSSGVQEKEAEGEIRERLVEGLDTFNLNPHDNLTLFSIETPHRVGQYSGVRVDVHAIIGFKLVLSWKTTLSAVGGRQAAHYWAVVGPSGAFVSQDREKVLELSKKWDNDLAGL